MRATTTFVLLIAASGIAFASEASRFSGEGALVEGANESSDGRFALKAELEQGDTTQRGGRFDLDARLAVSDLAKTTGAACATGGDIFKNGFE